MTTRTQPRTISRASPSRRFDWIGALLLLAAGGISLYQVVTTTTPITGPVQGGLSFTAYARAFLDSPNTGAVIVLLLALGTAVWGGAWFVTRLLHWRLRPVFEPLKVWRQSLWVAVFVMMGAWLQLNRALNLVLAGMLAGAFALIEVYLNVRER